MTVSSPGKLVLSLAFGLSEFIPRLVAAQADVWTIEADPIDPSHYFGDTVANGVIGIVSSTTPFHSAHTYLASIYDVYKPGTVTRVVKASIRLGSTFPSMTSTSADLIRSETFNSGSIGGAPLIGRIRLLSGKMLPAFRRTLSWPIAAASKAKEQVDFKCAGIITSGGDR